MTNSRFTRTAIASAVVASLYVLCTAGTPTAYAVGHCKPAPKANLAGCNFIGADLLAVNLSNANLTGTNFTGANLRKATLTHARVSGARFAGAVLTSSGSGRLVGVPASLPARWRLIKGYLVGPGANLADANLAGANLKGGDLGGAALAGANFTNADLTASDLHGVVGSNANFTNATLTGTNFGRSNLMKATFTRARITHAKFAGSTLTYVVSGGVTGTPESLPGHWRIVEGYLVGPGADLTAANFTGINLTGVDLAGSELIGVNLTNTNLFGANLQDAVVDGINLSNTDLTNANLNGLISMPGDGGFHGTDIGTPASLPFGWQVLDGFLLGPGVHLMGRWAYASLAGVNFTGADLDGFQMVNVDLTGVNLTNADLRDSTLVSDNLTNVNVSNTDFTNSSIGAITSSGIVGIPLHLPNGVQLVNGHLIAQTQS